MWKKLFRRIVFTLIAVAGVVVCGAILLQTYFAKFLHDYIHDKYGWSVKIGSAQIQFYPLAVKMENIEISQDPGGEMPFIEARSAAASLPYSSFWGDEFVVKAISLDASRIQIDPLLEISGKPTSEKKATPSFSIGNIELKADQVQVRNHTLEKVLVSAFADSGQMELHELQASWKSVHVQSKGKLTHFSDPDLALTYEINGNVKEITAFFPEIGELSGEVSTNGTIEGTLPKLLVRGKTKDSEIRWNNSSPIGMQVDYQYNRGEARKPVSLQGHWRALPLTAVQPFLGSTPPIASISSGKFEYSGDTNIWGGQGKFSVGLEAHGSKGIPLSGNIHGQLSDGAVRIDDSLLQMRSTSLTATGQLRKETMDLGVVVHRGVLSDMGIFDRRLAKLPGVYDLTAKISGPYKDVVITPDVQGSVGESQIMAHGAIRPARKNLSLQVDGHATAAELREFLPEFEAGNIQFNGTVQGNWNSPALQASLVATEMSISGVQIESILAQVESRGKSWNFEVEAPAAKLKANGVYTPSSGMYEVRGEVSEITAEQIAEFSHKNFEPLHGVFAANFEAAGSLKKWKQSRGSLEIQATQLQWKEVEVDIPVSKARFENGIAYVEVQTRSQSVNLQLSGSASIAEPPVYDLQAEATIDAAILQKLSPDWKSAGSIRLDASLQGTTLDPQVEGTLHAEDVSFSHTPSRLDFLFASGDIKVQDNTVVVQGNGSLNGSPLSIEGTIPMEKQPGSARVVLHDFPVATLSPESNLAGTVSLVAEVAGESAPLAQWKKGIPFRDWTAKMTVTPSGLQVGKVELTADAPLQLSLRDRVLRLEESHIRSEKLLDLMMSGTLRLEDQALDVAARLNSNLHVLAALRADVQSSGPLALDVRIGGTIQKPVYEGNIELKDVTLRIPNTPIFVEDLELQASLDVNRLVLQKLDGRSGGGTLKGGGEIVRGRKGSELWIQGKNVALNYPEGLRSQSDFDLKLTVQDADVLLSGDINVLQAFYEQELNLRNPILRSFLRKQRALTADNILKNRLKLAIHVRTVHDLLIQNSLASVRAGGDLRLRGSVYKPVIVGKMGIRPGSRLFVAGNQFDVENASVDFYGTEVLEPQLEVTLTTLLRDYNTDTFYEVSIPFSGTTSNIEFRNVRSNPSLSEDQIFSLLTYGAVESGQPGTPGSMFERQLLSYLAGQVFSQPVSNVAKTFGLSRIQIQQEGLSSANDSRTRLVLSKDITSSFSLIYSFVLNETQGQTWIVSYRHGRNIVARFIEQDGEDYTANINHRIAFGKGADPVFIAADAAKERGPGITAIQITNNSPLEDKDIQSTLKIKTGDAYDYWKFQERADSLKEKLQNLGYLSPVVRALEEPGDNSVSLHIEVRGGDLAVMEFRGYELNKKLAEKYKKWWRYGISPSVCVQLIQEDLIQYLNRNGYYDVSVQPETAQLSGRQTYIFHVNTGVRAASVELQFRGAENYPPEALQNDLLQTYSSPVEVFAAAIRSFSSVGDRIKDLYAHRGFLKTEVTAGSPIRKNGNMILPIEIQEGPISHIASMSFPEGLELPQDMQASLTLRPGETFRPDALLSDQLRIEDYYHKSGYSRVSANYSFEMEKDGSQLVVNWDLNLGKRMRIASIRVEGNETTRSNLILEQLGLKEGDLLTQSTRAQARKRLSDLGVFQQVSLITEETATPEAYDLVVRVAENKRYELQYGLRYSTEDNLGAEFRISDFNLLGTAQSVGFYMRSSSDLPLFRVDYQLPVTQKFWDKLRVSFLRDIRDDDAEALISGDLVLFPFEVRELTFQVQQERKLGRIHRLVTGFDYGSVTASFVDPDSGAPGSAAGTQTLFRAALLSDTRDDPLNAMRGYFYSIDGEFAPVLFGSDINYAKNFSQFFYYKKFGSFVSASGVRAGFLSIRNNILTIAAKFRSGGSTTLRGFHADTVVPGDDLISLFFGGNSLFIVNQELRFPVYKWFSAAVFYDGGNVYLQATDFDPLDLRHSAGFGIRGGAGGFLLRLDFGFNLDPLEGESRHVIHFGIGQAF